MTLRVVITKMAFSHSVPEHISEHERRIYFRKEDEPDYGEPAVGDESYFEEGNWKYLPATILVDIYEYIEDGDKFNMALACKAWSEIFNYPSLWRHREFRFGGLRASRCDSKRAVNFARRFGNYLRSLVITCEHPTQSVAKSFQKTIKEITGTLMWKHCQLKEFYMPRLHLDRFWRITVISNRLANSMTRFLRKQEFLRTFDMSNAGLLLENGLKVLQAISGRPYHYNYRLRELNIEDFFLPRSALFRVERFVTIMGSFHRLTTLSLNYSYLSDEVLQSLMTSCGNNLIFINIKVYRNDPNFHRIQPQIWKAARRISPKLQVNVYFEGIGDYTTITRVVSPEIPIIALQLWTGLHHQDQEWQLPRTLRYIGDCYSETLEELSLGLETGIEVIDDSLLYMLPKLRKLEDLDLHTSIERPQTIEQICVMQLENKLGMVKCHINLDNLTGEDIELVEEIADNFEEMINDRGCDFHIEFNEIMLF